MNTEATAIKAAADQIIPRQQDTQRHLERLEHCISWLELCRQDYELNDDDRLKIREFSAQIENFCDELHDHFRERLSQHDPAHGLLTDGLTEIVEAYK